MSSIIPWLEITIAGFVYLSAGFFLILRIFDIRNLDFLNKHHKLLPYVSIVIVFLSYTLGLTGQYMVNHVIALIKNHPYDPMFTIDVQANVPEQTRETFGNAYSNLVLFRHLILGSFLLGSSFLLWFRTNILRIKALAVCLVLSLLFLVVYCIHRDNFSRLENAIKTTYLNHAP